MYIVHTLDKFVRTVCPKVYLVPEKKFYNFLLASVLKKSIRYFHKDAIAFSTRLIFLKMHSIPWIFLRISTKYELFSSFVSNILGGSLIKQASLQGQKSSNNMEIL